MFPIIQGLVNFCWFLFKWGLVVGLLAVVIGVSYFYRQVDEKIRCRVEEKIAGHYTGLEVSIHSAELVEGEGIRVRGLSILEPGTDEPRAALIDLEELFLSCRADLEELASGEPEVTQIVLRRPTLRVTRRPDGSWNAAKLLPMPKLGRRSPAVVIENGTIEIFDPLKNPPGTLTLREVNLTLAPPEDSSPPGPGGGMRALQGTLAGDFVGRVEIEGLVDPERLQWSMAGSVEGLEISPELRGALPAPFAAKLAELGSLRGQAKLAFRVGYDPEAESPCRFDVSGQLVQGRLDDPRVPRPLTEVRANFRLNNEGFAVDELFASSGPSTLRMSCRRAGYDEHSPLRLEAEVRDLELDSQLIKVLPDTLRDQWPKYLPTGRIHANLKLAYDGQTWRPEASVQCLNVSFSYYKFPYQLQNAKGTLELKDDLLRVNLTGYSGSQPVRITGEVVQPTSAPAGWIEAKGENLELDEKLFTALPEKSRAVIRSLDPRGTVNFYLRVWRDRPDEPMRRHLVVDANRCSVCYAKFPYPIGNIRGTLEMLDKQWTFRNLEGTNDTGRITCEGELGPTPEGTQLVLRLAGQDVPLEEELRDALGRPNMQRLWNDLKLTGMVDLSAEVRYLAGRKQLSVAFRAEPQSQTTTIEPAYFPYRMENLRGVLTYRDGHVTIERFQAEHGDVKLSATVACDFLPDGSWHLHLGGLSVDRLRPDRELIQALPERLKKAVVELNPDGPINLRGSLDLARGGNPADRLTSQWDLECAFCQASLDFGVKLENLNGGLTLVGGFDGRHFHSRGELAVDSLTYKDLQFTQIMGPLWIDDQQVLLGSWVDRRRGGPAADRPDSSARQPRPITAQLFGGTLYGDGWVTLGPVPRYGLRATLSQADLGRCAQEVMTGPQRLRGNVLATVDLRGTGRSLNAMGGRGNIRLREADIYELPLMIALLKILSIREPDRSAFSQSDIDFRIEGTHVYFDRINFNGDAISLEGTGEMNLDRQIRLTFRAMLGRQEVHLPLLRDVLGGASQQIMLIHVGGTLEDPVVKREAFPGVNQALQQFQAEMEKTTGVQGLFPQARQPMPAEPRRLPKKQ